MTHLVFVAAFVAYLFSIFPAIGWEDSTEVIIAGRMLAPMHPPGTPLPVLLSRVAQMLPLGAAAFRVHLAQAVAAAVLVTCVFRYVSARSSEAAGLFVAIALGIFLWPVTVHAEVYVYAMAGILLMAVMVEQWWGAGARLRCSSHVLAGLGLGLGLSCSVLLLPYLLAPVLVTLLDRKDRSKTAAMWVLGLVVGLALYVLLPFRAAQPSLCTPPDLASLGGLWRYLSGASFREQLSTGVYTPSPSAWGRGALLALIPLGLWWFARGDARDEAEDTPCPGLWLIGSLLQLPWSVVPTSRSGLHFFLPAILCTLILAALATRRLTALARVPAPLLRLLKPSRPRWIARGCAAAIVVFLAWEGGMLTGHAHGAHAFLERISDPLRPGDRVVCGEIDVTFMLWYAKGVERDLAGVDIAALAFEPKARAWKRFRDSPPGPRIWFDFDLPAYGHRHDRSSPWLDTLRPDGLLLRPVSAESRPAPAGAERQWLDRAAPILSHQGSRQLAYRYLNLAKFCRSRNLERARVYEALARHLLAPDR